MVDWLLGSRRASQDVDSAFDSRIAPDCIRREMSHALQGCGDLQRQRMQGRIRCAREAMDLWQLRPELYLCIAQDLGQLEATRRINALTPLFRGWVPHDAAPRVH